MKKLFALALVMVLALSLAACSSGNSNTPSDGGNTTNPSANNSTPSSNDNMSSSTPNGGTDNPNNTGGKIAMSVTVPDGWTERTRGDGTIVIEPYDPGTYHNTFVMLYVENNYKNLGGRAYVEELIENGKKYDIDDSEFSGVGDVTAAGKDAFYYNVHRTRGDTLSRYYYVFKGSDVYVFQSTIYTEFMGEEIEGDISDMYASWTLE
jgi:ABC-type glycerol-3-phosphate transport system substrate-binding protein